MARSIDELKATFASSGFAKPNRYRVILPETADSRELDIMCDSVVLPGKQILTTEENITMKTEYKGYGFGTEDVEISFILSNDFKAWDYLYDWQQKVIRNINSTVIYRVAYKNDYTYNVDIEQYDSQGTRNKSVTLINAFVTSLNSIELGNANENEIIRVSASLTYDNWIIKAGLNPRR